MMDDGRILAGILGVGVLAAASVSRGSRAVEDEYRAKWARWSDDLWSFIQSGPATKVPPDLRSTYLLLTAKWVGDGFLEDPSVFVVWTDLLPNYAGLTMDELLETHRRLSSASKSTRKWMAAQPLLSIILSGDGPVEKVVAGPRWVSFPDWRFLPGAVALGRDGEFLVENRLALGPAAYVVRPSGSEVEISTTSSLTSGRRGVCPAAFEQTAKEMGVVYSLCCGPLGQVASFALSTSILLVR